MAKTLHINHPAVTFFWRYWEHHCPGLGEAEWKWFTQYATLLRRIKRGQQLFVAGEHPDYLYFVCEGLLAAVSYDSDAQRRIFEFAPAEHSLLTTELNAPAPFEPEIVALRASAAIALPADALYDYSAQHMTGATLTHLLDEKRAAKMRWHYTFLLLANNRSRYLSFRKNMHALWKATTLQEHADFLNLSHSTVRRIFRNL